MGHKALFEHFWETTLELGRIPANSEFEDSERLRRVVGSHKKAFDSMFEFLEFDPLNASVYAKQHV